MHSSANAAPCRIGVFLSTPIMERHVREYMAQSRDNILTTYDLFTEAQETARRWEREGVEMFVSRRCTAAILSETVSTTPVFSLPHSPLDLMTSLRGRCGPGATVMLTNFREEMRDAEQVASLLGINLIQGIFTSVEHMGEVVRDAPRLGASLVIGGWATKVYAERYGIPFVELVPSRDHFFGALENARNAVLFNREREALMGEYQCVLDAVSEGMLSVDRQGRILSLNPPARRLLRLAGPGSQPEDLAELLLGDEAAALMAGKTRRYEALRSLRGRSLIINAYPVLTKGSVERLVITLRAPRDVMRQENKVRSSLTKSFTAPYELEDILHSGKAMRSMLDLAAACADTDASVLLMGETGTGKEMVAQGIHNAGPRRNRPFVSVNCAELPEQLLESELFGHEEGAFTGARKGGKAGLFELAHSGTIFLDEINSSSATVQIKLLRVLQEKEIMRVGGTRKIPIDVKVIAATGSDLWRAVQEGSFRKDLFFRLNVLPVVIPPLRERPGDIAVLFPAFLRRAAQKLHADAPTVTREQLAKLTAYAWPGNVRQLRHFAESYVLRATRLGASFDDLYAELLRGVPGLEAAPATPPPIATATLPALPPQPEPEPPLHSPRERARIQAALVQARYRKTEAARLLGMGRTTLWRKMRELGL